ncbi:MAG: hypothetical protein AAGE52_01270 [Myxococcota bacterium]
MTIRVPVSRGQIVESSLLNGLPVSATDWRTIARLQNWLRSRGRQLVPTFRPDHSALPAGDTYTYAVLLRPSFPNFVRLWSATLRGTGGSFTEFGGGSVSGTSPLFTEVGPGTAPAPTQKRQELGAQSNAEVQTTLDVTTGATFPIEVDALSVWELPRAVLTPAIANELAAVEGPFTSEQPISRAAFDDIWDIANQSSPGNRVFAHWAVPYITSGGTTTQFAASTTSGTYADVFHADIPALARKLDFGATQQTAAAKVFAWVSDGATQGEVRLAPTLGSAGTAITITNTSPAWSTELTASLDCEDLGTADGLQGGTFDGVQVEFRRTAGAGTLFVASAVAYEP